MYQGFQLYDSHAHLGTARHSGRRHTAEMLLRDMDRQGVDRALLIPFPVVEDYAREHNQIAAALRAWPDRFAGAACLDPYAGEHEYRQEVRRCADMGFRALKLQPQYQAVNPLSTRGDFIYAAAHENRLVVVVHTGSGIPFALPSLYIAPARRFPELSIVLGHAGGSTLFLEAVVAAQVCPNLYIELSSLMPHHIIEILAHVPAGRLMVGSDLPESMGVEMHKVLEMDLPDPAKRQILWETAAQLFDR